MHDRRIEGETYTFGNAGGLYLGAMTWWDHQTLSIWSQPVAEALQGELAETRLRLLPSQVTTWGSWRESHPHTFAMINDVDRLGSRRQGFAAGFVIGVVIGEQARAYYYRDVLQAGAIHDSIADLPILVWAQADSYQVYLRQVKDLRLTLVERDPYWADLETGTTWDLRRGRALQGPLSGEVLQPLPSLTAFDWAWMDFYPFAGFYQP